MNDRIRNLRAALSCAETYDIDGMRLVARRALLADDEVIETIGGTEVALLKENAALRTRISMLELSLDEIYCSVRRAKPAPECPTDCKAVLHDELYSRNIELLHIAVRNHNAECDALEKVHRLEERNDDANAELVRLRNIIAENNFKPSVTGQGFPPRPAPKKG